MNAVLSAFGAKDIVNGIIKVITIIAVLIALIYIVRKLSNMFKYRNVGTSGGSDNGQNMAYDFYSCDSVFFPDYTKLDKLSAIALNLSDNDLIRVNDSFVKLYGDKCRGGGVSCEDTTSLKSFVSGFTFLVGGENRDRLVSRLQSLGL